MFPLSSTYHGAREWRGGLIYEMTKDGCVVTHCEYSWNVCMYVNRTNCLGFIVSNRLLLDKVEKVVSRKGGQRGKRGCDRSLKRAWTDLAAPRCARDQLVII